MQNFDFNEALKAIQSGKPITGSDGVLAPLIKQLTEPSWYYRRQVCLSQAA